MAGVELATAYVSLAATAKGLRENVRQEFRLVERDAQDTGRTIGTNLTAGAARAGKGISSDVQNGMSDAAASASKHGQQAGDRFTQGLRSRMSSASSSFKSLFSGASRPAEAEGEKAGESFSRGMASKLKESSGKIASMAGVGGLGALVAKGFADTLDLKQGTAKLTAQLGLSEDQAARAGAAAGKLFSGNMGDSADISEAMKSVMQDIDGMRGASEKTLESMSGKALTVSKTFDQDLGGVTRAVSQLMRTGMAKSADEAFDIITKGFQSGANKSDDLLDTLNEYGTQFRKVGLSGADATGLINQGLQGGARDADLVADAVKEFSIRAVDGSKTTVAAYKDLGLNADAMTAKIAKGGPAAKQGLGEILTRLRAVKDPAQQAQIATSLFGTQAEDLGKALFALHPETAAKGLGDVAGATDKANKAMNSTPQAKLQNFIRSLQGGLVQVLGTKVVPAMEKFKKQFEDGEGAGGQFRDALEKVKSTIQTVVSFVQAHPDLTKGLVVGVGGLLATKKGIDGIKGALDSVKTTVDTAKGGLSAFKSGLDAGAKAASGGRFDSFGKAMKAAGSNALTAGRNALSAAGNFAKVGAGNAVTGVRNLGTALRSAGTNALTSARAATTNALAVARQGTMSALAAAKTAIMTGATKAMAVAQRALNLVMRMNPIGIVITALVALGVGLVAAYRKSETFRNIVNAAWRVVKSAIKGTVDWFQNTAWPAFRNVLKWLGDKMNDTKGVIQRAWNAIKDKFSAVKNWVTGAFKKSWDTVKTILSKPIEWAKQGIDREIAGVKRIFNAVKDFMTGGWKRSWDTVKGIITKPIDLAKSSIQGILGRDDKSGLRGVFNTAVTAVKKIWDKLKSIVAKPINGVIGIINSPFISGFNKLGKPFGLTLPSIPKIAGYADGGRIPGRAGGGTIPGPWRGPKADNVLGVSNSGMPVARVNPGEFITSYAATQRMERKHPGALNYINRYGDLPGHASGGFAGMPHANTGAPHTARGRFESYRPSVSIVALGKFLQSKGFDVGQHPAFGGVARVHMGTSLHYANQALDVNADGMPGGEDKNLSALARALVSEGWGTIWHSAGHFDHLHVDTGIITKLNNKLTTITKTNMLVDAIEGLASTIFNPLKSGAFKLIDGAVGKFGGGDFTKKILGGVAKKAIDGAISWGNDGSGGVDTSGTEGAPANVSGAVALGKQLAAARGWTGGQWDALYQLWQHESGWNVHADNPTSDAYGIPQALPGSKMGAGWQNSAEAQIKWGLGYIAQRYGTPSNAWATWNRRSPHWYADGGLVRDAPVFDRGGTLAPGLNVVHNKLGRPEPLVRAEDVLSERRGDINVNVTGVKYDAAPDIAREITHELSRHDMAGRYREVWA